MSAKLKVAIICGGPSLERGISLNSARSICDHLDDEQLDIIPIYFDYKKRAFEVSRAQLYSNTPSDFDFKLRTSARALSAEDLVSRLKEVDIAFPAIHGQFGEDGELQSLLEEAGCPFVGSPSSACKIAFDKTLVSKFIAEQGFYTIPQLALSQSTDSQAAHVPATHTPTTEAQHSTAEMQASIESFFAAHSLSRAIVKPARGGSSIAVTSVTNPQDALAAAQKILSEQIDNKVVVEPFCKGREFTVVIIENLDGRPVALFPIEVEMDYGDNQIFDYRRKYLATRQVAYHCPARFDSQTISQIRSQASRLFTLLGMRDFARFDGWVLDDGKIYFPDFNPISGMEQNSFLFIQASQLGMSHRDILRFILRRSCERQNVAFPAKPQAALKNPQQSTATREAVNVIFGGNSAERHVSVMSGTNVWLKLKHSLRYESRPYLLDIDESVWELPYCLTLFHTVEEIADLCRTTPDREQRIAPIRASVLSELDPPADLISESHFIPKHLTLDEFIDQTSLCFIALHGGIGENGELQKKFEAKAIPFTGSGSTASALCMDKFKTGLALAGLEKEGIFSSPKELVDLIKLSESNVTKAFDDYCARLGSASLIVKPVGDGCSAGVAKLCNASDLEKYLLYARRRAERIPAHTLSEQDNIIEMPPRRPDALLLENYVETMRLTVKGDTVVSPRDGSPWIEVTVGVLGRPTTLHAMNPSITVASSAVLSLEEKFQGGTGINITPPPPEILSPSLTDEVRRKIAVVAEKLGIRGFARIDAFVHTTTGDIVIIEANTVPGLTPSTVLYHQGLAEHPPLYPRALLEKFLEYA